MQKDFLQSNEWMKFQEAVGRKTFHLEGENFWANIVEHKLPIVGKYFYVPRGPIFHPEGDQPLAGNFQSKFNDKIFNKIQELVNLAKENNAGWIRFDAGSQEIFDAIKNAVGAGLVPAPHDMQPREVFIIDISKSEEDLLAEMKAKTRYNIRIAQKRGIVAKVISNFKFQISNQCQNPNDKKFKFYADEFIRLTWVMAKRNKITAHPEDYYRKMLENISPEILKLYVAEYQGKIIAANLMVFYGDTCTYLHGASAAADEYKNVMAPYFLQWQAILDAKKKGCKFYDFGGVKTGMSNVKYQMSKQFQISNFKFQISKGWAGIAKFKMGFSPKTKPVEFLGSYDIIINRKKYFLYRLLQRVKKFFNEKNKN